VPARPFRRLIVLLIVVPLALVAIAVVVAVIRAPSVSDLAARVAALERANGVRPVPLSRIPPSLREAVVATEDERFYRQSGVDVIALARAVPYDATHLSLAQGASTITEQLGKLTYLQGNDHSPWRKLTDIALGFRIGHRYDHEQVLDDYLNVAYFGDGAYGVANAAHRYFGRDVSALDLAQASLLAGLGTRCRRCTASASSRRRRSTGRSSRSRCCSSRAPLRRSSPHGRSRRLSPCAAACELPPCCSCSRAW